MNERKPRKESSRNFSLSALTCRVRPGNKLADVSEGSEIRQRSVVDKFPDVSGDSDRLGGNAVMPEFNLVCLLVIVQEEDPAALR